jgi:hypothetical protein
MTMWFRKVIKCGLCKSKVRKKDTWQLHMNTADGPHQVTICKDCTKTMEEIKGNIGTWLD